MIKKLILHPFEMPLKTGCLRKGVYIQIVDDTCNEGWGECAPLPRFSRETLEDCIEELTRRQDEILQIEWTENSLFSELKKLQLLPAVSFGLESALLSVLSPLEEHQVQASALLMGSVKEILAQADLREAEGYRSAKLKVGSLNFDDAAFVIHRLKKRFHLRIDVNRAWKTTESLRFFLQFDSNTFDYVEEPFQNPKDLIKFPHPFAVDESYPHDLSLNELEILPLLKALIYKPTIQGGLLGCLHLKEWAAKMGVSLVLSSAFESALGLSHVSSLSHRLSLSSPVGIGTADFIQ